MNKTQPVVAIIPARGSSKGIYKKNLKLVGGKPLIWYTVNAAINSKKLNRIIISTDDKEIADYIKSLSEDIVIYLSPKRLSLDDSPSFPVIQWALEKFEKENFKIDFCVTLRATSPLRTTEDINNAIEILETNPKADSVISVSKAVGIHPIRLKRINEKGLLKDAFNSEGNYPVQRQKLEEFYIRNGAIYVTKANIIKTLGLWGEYNLPYIMPQERSVNINTNFEMKIAELILKKVIKL